MNEKEVSEVIAEFLNYIDCCRNDYKAAHEAVGKEDKRLQDLLHEMEFSEGENGKRRAATRLRNSRRERRRQKDEVMRQELIVSFFDEPQNKKVLNNLRQILGRQRKQEEFLKGKREYKPRVKE